MLDSAGADVREERSSRKNPLSDKEARGLLSKASKVIVARGRKSVVVEKPGLADLKGPSGNYRAPMILKGKTLLVGFNVEALEGLV